MAGTFMVVLDFFIVNVALPSIQSRLHAGAGATEWVVAGYGIALAAFLIAAGRLGDAFGRRRLFTIGLTVARCRLLPALRSATAGRGRDGAGASRSRPLSARARALSGARHRPPAQSARRQ